MTARRAWLTVVAVALLASRATIASEETAKAKAPAAPAAKTESWPKPLSEGGVDFTVYQPQPSAWDGYRLSVRHGGSLYRVQVQAGHPGEAAHSELDGVAIADGAPLLDDGREHEMLLRLPPG